jgi:uncharacterized phage-associated protein
VRIPFNETKATQAAAHLLHLRGGKMNYMKLIKLLYLVDRGALLRWGRPVTTDRYVSMDHGPVLSRVLDLINEIVEPQEKRQWSRLISSPEGHDVRLKVKNPPSGELSRAELRLIDEVFQKYGRKSRWELVHILHSLPEWEDPEGGAIPIGYADILNASGKSQLEINAILHELENVGTAESLVRSH